MKLKPGYLISAMIFLLILDLVGAFGLAMIYREFQA